MSKKIQAALVVCFLVLGFFGFSAQAQQAFVLNNPPEMPARAAAENPLPVFTYSLYLPLAQKPAPPPPWVDIASRDAVKMLYQVEYLGSVNNTPNWTGSQATCNPGTTDPAFRDAILRRINYFRSMAGIPPILGLNDTYNTKAQAAALMMSANAALSHNPPSTWICYTAEGAEAAGSSNLYLGVTSSAAISGYIQDPGGGNYPVGHRRWILYPQTLFMGTGDIPSGGGFMASNALWVFDENMWKPRPATREAFVAWPPPGYVPYQVVYARWSFAYADADFSQATVNMSGPGGAIAVSVNPTVDGYGENTLVWEPQVSFGIAPPADTSYQVTIQNVKINDVPTNFNFTVIIFDPSK